MYKFETTFLDLFQQIGEFEYGTHSRVLALNNLFDFLLHNKHIVDNNKALKSVLEMRLIENTCWDDYKMHAYHYLHALCDVKFHSLYDEVEDRCIEFFYDRFNETYRVLTY